MVNNLLTILASLSLEDLASNFQIKWIMYGVDIMILLGIVLAFLVGFIKGHAKAMHHLIVATTAAVIFLFTFGPIAKLILNATIPNTLLPTVLDFVGIPLDSGEVTNTIQLIINYKAKTLALDSSITMGEETLSIVSDISYVIVRLVVYIVGLILLFLLRLVIRFVFFIIRAILGIELKKVHKNRLLGGLCSVGKFAVYFILVYLPIFGLLTFTRNIAQEVYNNKDYIMSIDQNQPEVINDEVKLLSTETSEIDEAVVYLEQYIDAVDSSLTKKIILDPLSVVIKDKNNLSIEERYLSSILSFKSSQGRIELIKEVKLYTNAISAVLKISNLFDTTGQLDLSVLSESDIDAIARVVSDSSLIRYGIPALLEIASNNISEGEQQLVDILIKLKDIDFKEEFNTLGSIISGFATYKDIQIDINNINDLITNRNAINYLKYVCERIFDLKIVTKVGLPYAMQYAENKVKSDKELSKLNIDFEAIKSIDFEKEGKSLVGFVFVCYDVFAELLSDLPDEVQEDITLTSNYYKDILSNPKLPSHIKTIFSEINKIELVKNIVLPLGLEVFITSLENQEAYSDLHDEFTELRKVELSSSITQIGDFLATTLESIQKLGVIVDDEIDPNTIIKNSAFPEEIEKVIKSIANVQALSDHILPLVIKVSLKKLQENETFKDIDAYDALKDVVWKNELNSIASFAKVLAVSYQKLDLDFDKGIDYKELLKSDKLVQVVKDISNSVLTINFICKDILPIAAEVLIANLESKPEFANINVSNILKDVNWKTELEALIDVACDLISAIQNTGYELGKEYKVDEILRLPNLSSEISNIVDSVTNVPLVRDKIINIVFDALINKLEDKYGVEEFGLNFEELRSTVWKDEISSLSQVLICAIDSYNTLDIDVEDWTKVLDNPELESCVNDIMDKVLSSNLVKDHLMSAVSYYLSDFISKTQESIPLDIEVLIELTDKDSIVELLDNNTDKIISILKDIKSLGLLGKESSTFDLNNKTTQTVIIKMVKTIFSISVVEGKEEAILDSLLNTLSLKDTLLSVGITLHYDEVTNWNSEIDIITSLFSEILSLTDSLDSFDFATILSETDSSKKETVVRIVDYLSKGKLFGDSIFDMINNLVVNMSSDYDLSLTEEDKQAIKLNTWKKEIETIFEIIELKDQLEGIDRIEHLDAELVRDLMVTASQSVIASKVLGTILNEALGDAVAFDLRSQNAMSTCADTVYNAIKLSQIVANPETIDLSNPEDISKIVSSVEGLASNEEVVELANDFINEVLVDDGEEPLTLTQEQIASASETIQKVLDERAGSIDPNDFSYEDLPSDVKDELNESDLAQLILGFLMP